ncbi:MAG: hypothetical protein EZS28_040630, partial [Streblomastix strix]
LLKANQTTTYTKTETDYLISQIEVGDVDLSGYMTLGTSQTITANKTFNNACRFVSSIDGMGTITGSSFVKSGADDTVVLLGAGGTKPLSEFSSGGASIEDLTGQVAINITATGFNYSSLAFVKIGNLYLYQMQVSPKQEGFAPSMNIKIGTLPSQYAPTVSELYMPVGGPYGAFKPHICSDGDIRCHTVNDSWIQQINAAGLSDFPELYAYIKERYPKPIGELPQPVPIGDQTLQQQVKNNDDIIFGSNEVFEPPVPNAITKLDLSSQLERNSFLASSGSDPTLIVYGDRITLTASYATTGVFPNGYLFKSYPQEARPKQGDQVIALVGTDASNNLSSIYTFDIYIQQKQIINPNKFKQQQAEAAFSFNPKTRKTYLLNPTIIYCMTSNISITANMSDEQLKPVAVILIATQPVKSSILAPPLLNSDNGLVPPAPSNTTVSSAPDLTNDEPVMVPIPSIELTNLQALLNVLFAVIVYEVPNVIQPLKSTSPTSIYDIKQSVSVLVQVVV